jgi:hypothetical protein
MTITLNGTTGINTPGVVNTAAGTVATTLAVTGVSTLTGGFTVGATAAPAFSAYLSANQTVSSAAFTKIAFNSEEFDTASAFDSTTNYRFTPLVTGYYQFNLSFFTSGGTVCFGNIYKNGSNVVSGSRTDVATTSGSMLSYLIYLNGSTDYVEFYGYTTTSTTFVGTNVGGACKASGFLARSA